MLLTIEFMLSFIHIRDDIVTFNFIVFSCALKLDQFFSPSHLFVLAEAQFVSEMELHSEE